MATNLNPYSNSKIIRYSEGDQSLERGTFKYSHPGDDTTHTVIEGETLQSIAHTYYGDSGAWCLVADANSLVNPLEDLITGLVIIIPNI